jgi:hypothetical protein
VNDSPVFIVGVPRSGTTLLRLVLNRHPRVAIPSETGYFADIYDRFAGDAKLWRQAVDCFLDRCGERLVAPVGLDPARSALLALDEPDYAQLLALPLSTWAAAEGKPRWGEKSPYHAFHADSIMRLFPRAMMIVMVRDPRATVPSMDRLRAQGPLTALHARLWRESYTAGLATVRRSVPPAQRLELRYEALISDPEAAIRAVVEFLGEEFDDALLTFYTSSALYETQSHAARVRQPIGGDPEGWRHELSEREIAIIEAVCGPVMESLGYQRVGRRPRLRERANIAFHSTYAATKKWQNRAVRYHPVSYRPFLRFRRP